MVLFITTAVNVHVTCIGCITNWRYITVFKLDNFCVSPQEVYWQCPDVRLLQVIYVISFITDQFIIFEKDDARRLCSVIWELLSVFLMLSDFATFSPFHISRKHKHLKRVLATNSLQ
jgi:hypothetical protein